MYQPRRPNTQSISIAFLTFLIASTASAITAADETALPFVGTDIITILEVDGRERQIGGRIEDIRGETLTLRRNGKSNIELIRLASVTNLRFGKPQEWDKGLDHIEEGEFRRGLEYFDKALNAEQREWAWNELQSLAAKTNIKIGKRRAAVDRIVKIFERDERSRHVSLLPLVWDARLPKNERIQCDVNELRNASVLRQLVACSALLEKQELQKSIENQLIKIRRESGLSRVSELAEAQLWRLYLLTDDKTQPLLSHWSDTVSQMPPSARGGPSFVLGRLQRKAHKYDDAALSFLWLPMMSPTDQALAARALFDATRCLRNAGRVNEANALVQELQARYPTTSAAQLVNSAPKTEPESPQ